MDFTYGHITITFFIGFFVGIAFMALADSTRRG